MLQAERQTQVKQAYHPKTTGNVETAYDGTRVYNWAEGKTYTLRFRSMSQFTEIDQIYITTDANDPYVKNHEHTFSTDWSYDATHHWHAATCEHTDKFSDKNVHVYDSDTDTQCNTCGAVRVICNHNYVNGVCSSCSQPRIFNTVNGFAVVEAEDAILDKVNVKVVNNADASGGKYVQGEYRNASGTSINGTDAVPADIDLIVRPDVSGTYYIWVRSTVRSDGGGTATWVDGDGWTDNSTGGYKYLSFVKTGSGMVWQKFAVSPTWTAGNEYNVKLAIWSRDPDGYFDQFVITTQADYTPEGAVSAQ